MRWQTDEHTPVPLKTRHYRNIHFLYDDSWLSCPVSLFHPVDRNHAGQSHPVGRGTALFFEYDGTPLVLKHYHRGGLIGRLVDDIYIRVPGTEPRMLAEYRLLRYLYQKGLPVPEPVAARYQQTSWLTCRGDLVTRRIPGARTLFEHLRREPLPGSQWRCIGATVATFHAAGVYHADLNATNILLDDRERPWLIDFDKGFVRKHKRWKTANLRRLRRSLDKLQHHTPEMHFSDDDWQAFLHGYRNGR